MEFYTSAEVPHISEVQDDDSSSESDVECSPNVEFPDADHENENTVDVPQKELNASQTILAFRKFEDAGPNKTALELFNASKVTCADVGLNEPTLLGVIIEGMPDKGFGRIIVLPCCLIAIGFLASLPSFWFLLITALVGSVIIYLIKRNTDGDTSSEKVKAMQEMGVVQSKLAENMQKLQIQAHGNSLEALTSVVKHKIDAQKSCYKVAGEIEKVRNSTREKITIASIKAHAEITAAKQKLEAETQVLKLKKKELKTAAEKKVQCKKIEYDTFAKHAEQKTIREKAQFEKEKDLAAFDKTMKTEQMRLDMVKEVAITKERNATERHNTQQQTELAKAAVNAVKENAKIGKKPTVSIKITNRKNFLQCQAKEKDDCTIM